MAGSVARIKGRRCNCFALLVYCLALAVSEPAADPAPDPAADPADGTAMPTWDPDEDWRHMSPEMAGKVQAYMNNGDWLAQRGDWAGAQAWYYLALGPEPDVVMAEKMFDLPTWSPPLHKMFAAFYHTQLAAGAIRLNPWPTGSSRGNASATWQAAHGLTDGDATANDSSAKPGWFGVFPGQASALAALQSRLGSPDPKQVDFVQQIESVAAFATEYLVPNRPVVVGAGASDALIGGFTDRVAKKMSRRKLSKIKAAVQVGRVPYFEHDSLITWDPAGDAPGKNRQAMKALQSFDRRSGSSKYTRDDAVKPLKRIEQCEKGVGHADCVALIDRWRDIQSKKIVELDMGRYVREVMDADTWADPEAPDMRGTFGFASKEIGKALGLGKKSLKTLPGALANVGAVKTNKCECAGCGCHFQFYLAPALAGSHPHSHKAAWNLLLRGRKRWYIHPPFYHLLGRGNGSQVWPGRDGGYKDSVYSWLAGGAVDHFASQGIPTATFEQLPGEVVFVPDNWPHAVINLEPSAGVAVEINRPKSK